MDGRRARLVDPLLDGVPRLRRTAPRTGPGLLTPRWAAVVGVGWPVAFLASLALEPAPADPQAVEPLVVELGSLAFIVALGFAVAAAFHRRRQAAVAGVVAGLVGIAFSISCPVSGHHAVGLWWPAQLGLMVAMTAASVAASRSGGTQSPSAN